MFRWKSNCVLCILVVIHSYFFHFFNHWRQLTVGIMINLLEYSHEILIIYETSRRVYIYVRVQVPPSFLCPSILLKDSWEGPSNPNNRKCSLLPRDVWEGPSHPHNKKYVFSYSNEHIQEYIRSHPLVHHQTLHAKPFHDMLLPRIHRQIYTIH